MKCVLCRAIPPVINSGTKALPRNKIATTHPACSLILNPSRLVSPLCLCNQAPVIWDRQLIVGRVNLHAIRTIRTERYAKLMRCEQRMQTRCTKAPRTLTSPAGGDAGCTRVSKLMTNMTSPIAYRAQPVRPFFWVSKKKLPKMFDMLRLYAFG